MKDMDFLTNIISEICDYAVSNGMEPDDTIEAIANYLHAILKISTFNNWEHKGGDDDCP